MSDRASRPAPESGPTARRAGWPALAIVGLLSIVHGLGARGSLGLAESVELAAYDLHYVVAAHLRPAPPPDERLLLLAYDEETQALEPGYLSTRDLFASLLNALADAGARLVFLDFRFDRAPLRELADRLGRVQALSGSLPPGPYRELREVVDHVRVDERLQEAMRRIPTLIPYVCAPGLLETRALPTGFAAKAGAARVDGYPPRVRRARIVPPLPDYVSAAAAVAHSCEFPDPDAVLRSDPAVLALFGEERALLPSAGTVIAREVMGLAPGEVFVDRAGVHLGARTVRFTPKGEVLLGLRGPGGSFQGRMGMPARHSVAAVLQRRVPAERLKGRVVLVGETAAGIHDAKITPFGYGERGRTPGIEKIAMHADYLLQAPTLLHRPDLAASWGFLLTALAGCVAVLLGLRLPFYAALASLPVAILVFFAGTLVLAYRGAWVDTAFPAIAWFGGLLAAALLRHSREVGERRFLESAFERYLPREVVRALVRDPSILKLAGEEREMTVLFADLRGFTSFAERSKPSAVVAHLNEHLTAMSEVIQRHGGTVDKFIGDAVMAFWGAPVPDPGHAVHACEAAREMLASLDRRNERRIVEGRPMVDMGIGINSGPMIVGNMGSTRRFNYTVIGDAVNLASRLEGLTKELHERILVGPRTRELVANAFSFRALGDVSVKGKQERVPVYSLEEAAERSPSTPATARASPAAGRRS